MIMSARMEGMTFGMNMLTGNIMHMTLARDNIQVQRHLNLLQVRDSKIDVIGSEFTHMRKELSDATRNRV